MKQIIAISMTSILIALVWTTGDGSIPGNPQTATDKRYPLLDFIESKVSEHLSKRLIMEISKYREILQYYDALLESRKESDDYDALIHEGVNNKLQLLIESKQKLMRDKANCEVQQIVQNIFAQINIEYLQTDIKGLEDSRRHEIDWNVHAKIRNFNIESRREYTLWKDELLIELPQQFEMFVQSLKVSEIPDNAELLTLIEEFMFASSKRQKELVLLKILDIMPKRVPHNDDSDSDCKWEIIRFIKKDL